LRTISQAELKPRSLVLDLGAGPGTYTRAINGAGHKCLGLDYSRKVLEAARRKGKTERYVQGEAYHLPFMPGVFDAVLCIGVLQSLEKPENALKEMRRVLKEDGHLFLDGLNDLFWIHRMRRYREVLSGSRRKLLYYDPSDIRAGLERMGFTEIDLHWLCIPGACQPAVEWLRGKGSQLISRLCGYSFLLHARKGRIGSTRC
jgi:SAM-dependent methyltransferase